MPKAARCYNYFVKRLISPSEDFVKIEHGQVAVDAAAGTSVAITLINADGFAAHDFVVVGVEGGETAELCQISSVSGQAITVATLKLAHKADEPVTKYRYNARKFYGSLTSAGTFTELTAEGSPVTIQADDPQGAVLEYNGGEGYLYFKSTYWNTYTSEESNIADAGTVLADESIRYCFVYTIRKRAGLTSNPFYTDQRIEVKRTQAENEINSALFARYILPLSEIPPLVSYLCELLAAGYIDYEEFGSEGQGVKWLGEARAILKNFTDGTRRLLKADLTELPRNTKTGVLDGYPNDASTDTAQFSMGDRF